jgi:hypothetical protein
MYACMYVCMYACMVWYVGLYVCMYVCVYVCTYVNTYVYAYLYMFDVIMCRRSLPRKKQAMDFFIHEAHRVVWLGTFVVPALENKYIHIIFTYVYMHNTHAHTTQTHLHIYRCICTYIHILACMRLIKNANPLNQQHDWCTISDLSQTHTFTSCTSFFPSPPVLMRSWVSLFCFRAKSCLHVNPKEQCIRSRDKKTAAVSEMLE